VSRDAIEFWSLLMALTVCSFMPTYPPLVLAWVTMALVWDRRYGPSWYRENPKTREWSLFILDFLICLPVVLVGVLAILLSKGGIDE